ncbi:MAG TPA: hypothetical protein VF681_14350 [Abditibacteriaceae bacterium]|jgi:hypothetical protein
MKSHFWVVIGAALSFVLGAVLFPVPDAQRNDTPRNSLIAQLP